jgi:hypothetical protein
MIDKELHDRLNRISSTIKIQKFGATTVFNDTSLAGTIGGKVGDMIPPLWRAKIGRDSDWHYGESMDSAIRKSLNGGTDNA